VYHVKLTTGMLADGARQGVDGKLYIFGGQWDQLFVGSLPTTQKLAFALVIKVEYSEALADHRLVIELQDEDRNDLGANISAGFRPGHPPMTDVGSAISVPLAIEPPPVPINQHGRLVWRISIDGTEVGELPMVVRPLPNQQLPIQAASDP